MNESPVSSQSVYNRQTLIDKPILVDQGLKPLLFKEAIESSVAIKEEELDHLEVSPYDQLYLAINSPFPIELVNDFIDYKKTEKMIRTRRRMFIPDFKFSVILRIDDHRQVVIWSNKSSTELQFQGKWSSFEFIEAFVFMFFEGCEVRFARIDINFDIRRSLPFIAERLRVKRMRRRRTYEIVPPRIIKDPKKGIYYEYNPSTEYHGKSIEYSLYDSGKCHSLGSDISRIEVKFKTMRVVPIRLFDEFVDLPLKKNLFDALALPFEHDLKKLSLTEKKHYKRLKNISYRRNCSLSLGIDLLRAKNRYQADCAVRALKKAEVNYFDFNKVFKNNHEIFINSMMTESETRFIDRVRSSMIKGI